MAWGEVMTVTFVNVQCSKDEKRVKANKIDSNVKKLHGDPVKMHSVLRTFLSEAKATWPFPEDYLLKAEAIPLSQQLARFTNTQTSQPYSLEEEWKKLRKFITVTNRFTYSTSSNS